MSVRASTWAWGQDTPTAGHKLVLLALADHAGEDFTCFPSTGRLSEKTGLAVRTIRKYIDDLVAGGLVAKSDRVRRADGTLSVWRYRLDHCPPDASGTPMPVAPECRTSDTGVPPPVTSGLRAEPSIEPSTNRQPRVSHVDEHIEELCNMLANSIEGRGSKRPTVTEAWRNDMDRLVRIDGRDPVDVAKVIRWLDAGEDDVAAFWRPNIRSAKKLRSQWDRMREQYERERNRPSRDEFVDPSAAAGVRAMQKAAELRRQRAEREEVSA